MTASPRLATPPIALGLAGLLPQAACLLLAVARDEARAAAVVAGGGYAALILSFLGGMWWIQPLSRGDARWSPYLLAVAPSLIAWGALVATLLGSISPPVALGLLGGALLASPLGDRRVGTLLRDVAGWRGLRLTLSGGLGVLTLLLAVVAGRG